MGDQEIEYQQIETDEAVISFSISTNNNSSLTRKKFVRGGPSKPLTVDSKMMREMRKANAEGPMTRTKKQVTFGVYDKKSGIKREEITEIKLNILSDQQLAKISAYEINNPAVDNVNGPMSPYLGSHGDIPCSKCGQTLYCPGHLGKITLHWRILNPATIDTFIQFFKVFCWDCLNPIANEEFIRFSSPEILELKGLDRLKVLADKFGKQNCSVPVKTENEDNDKIVSCGSRYEIKSKEVKSTGYIAAASVDKKMNYWLPESFYENKILALVDYDKKFKEDRGLGKERGLSPLELVGFDNSDDPKMFFRKYIPVSPIQARPPADMGVEIQSNITKIYSIIIEDNILLTNISSKMQQTITAELQQRFKTNLSSFYEHYKQTIHKIPGTKIDDQNSDPMIRIWNNYNSFITGKTEYKQGKEAGGIRGILEGKHGGVRQIVAQRTNQVARAIIAPSSSREIDVVELPEVLRTILTKTIMVTSDKIQFEYCLNLLRSGEIVRVDPPNEIPGLTIHVTNENRNSIHLVPGMQIYRKLQDGDYVMINRFPSLHQESIIGVRVKFIQNLRTQKSMSNEMFIQMYTQAYIDNFVKMFMTKKYCELGDKYKIEIDWQIYDTFKNILKEYLGNLIDENACLNISRSILADKEKLEKLFTVIYNVRLDKDGRKTNRFMNIDFDLFSNVETIKSLLHRYRLKKFLPEEGEKFDNIYDIHHLRTFGLPLALTKSLNADFDGDEMNVIVVNDYAGVAEIMMLMTPESRLLNTENKSTLLGAVLDVVSTLYQVTKENYFDYSEFLNYMADIAPLPFDKILTSESVQAYYDQNTPNEFFKRLIKNGVKIPKFWLTDIQLKEFYNDSTMLEYNKLISTQYPGEKIWKYKPGIKTRIFTSVNDSNMTLFEQITGKKLDISYLNNEERENAGLELLSIEDEKLHGRYLFSATLPKGFYYNISGVLIEDGIMKKGVLTKAHISASANSIHRLIALNPAFSQTVALKVLESIIVLGTSLAKHIGLSVSYQDCTLDLQGEESLLLAREKLFEEDEKLKTMNANPEQGVQLSASYLSQVGKVVKENTLRNMSRGGYSGMDVMIESGAKGEKANQEQISGAAGSQFVHAKTIEARMSGKTRFTPYTEKMEKSTNYGGVVNQGLVVSSYMKGLRVEDYSSVAQATRAAVSTSASLVPQSGKLSRQLAYFMVAAQAGAFGQAQAPGIHFGTYGANGLNGKYTSYSRNDAGVNYESVFGQMQNIVAMLNDED